MSDLYWLTDEQMARLSPYFPKSHAKPRVDDRWVLSGIIFVTRNGWRWRDAPREYEPQDIVKPAETVGCDGCVFARMMEGLSASKPSRRPSRSTQPMSRPTARLQPWGKTGDLGRLIGLTKGSMNTKLHAVTDANGRPLGFFITAGQVSDYTGAAALLDDLPKAKWMLVDRGYDAD